jgi:hypothetical protein
MTKNKLKLNLKHPRKLVIALSKIIFKKIVVKLYFSLIYIVFMKNIFKLIT